jgi:hypothetical protein
MKTDRILQIGFLLLPFMWLSTGRPAYGQFIWAIILVIAALSACFENRWIRWFGFYIAAWVLAIQLFRVFLPNDPTIRHVSFNVCNRSMYILIGLCVLYFVTRSRSRTETWLNWICAAAVVQCIVAIPQQFGVYPWIDLLNFAGFSVSNVSSSMAVGTLENVNFFSGFIAIASPLFFRSSPISLAWPKSRVIRIRWWFFIPLIAFHLLLSRTATAVAAASVAVMVIFPSVWIWAGMAAAAMLFAWHDGTLTRIMYGAPRFEFWKEAMGNIGAWQWPFGHGLGISWGKDFNLHNDWLQLVYELGVTGLALVSGYIATVYRSHRLLFAALVAACVNAGGNYPMHLPSSGILVVIIIGLIEKERLAASIAGAAHIKERKRA